MAEFKARLPPLFNPFASDFTNFSEWRDHFNVYASATAFFSAFESPLLEPELEAFRSSLVTIGIGDSGVVDDFWEELAAHDLLQGVPVLPRPQLDEIVVGLANRLQAVLSGLQAPAFAAASPVGFVPAPHGQAHSGARLRRACVRGGRYR